MSNLSNIGFHADSKEEFYRFAEEAFEKGERITCALGVYIRYRDQSGAELWLQVDHENELIGLNPHFDGKSRRKVCLTYLIESQDSELDGAYHAWAAPSTDDDPDSGMYPFVFDVPDFCTASTPDFPMGTAIQLTAFAQEITFFGSEQEYNEYSSQQELSYASNSFIPTGLFMEEGQTLPQAYGFFTGTIVQAEEKENEMTGQRFLWAQVNTLGGEVDVVCDLKLVNQPAVAGGILQGLFWLSGRLVSSPPMAPSKLNRNFFSSLFSKN